MWEREIILEKELYGGEVKLKFAPGNHCYYVNGKVTQGVTSALKELYPQDDLLEWYSSMASQDIVLEMAPGHYHETLKKAFLDHYKGEEPVLDLGASFDTQDVKTYPADLKSLYNLYVIGKNAPKKRSQYGKDVGTQVHEAIDRYHGGKASPDLIESYIEPSGQLEQDEAALKSFRAYVKWFEQSALKVHESERMVYSKELNYAGTLDRVYETPEGDLLIGDFKTSNLSRKSPLGIRESYWSQLGAYAKAYAEEMGVSFKDAVIVNSPKNGTLKLGYASDMGLSVPDIVNIWEDDIKSFRNHKFLRSQQARLKSRT